MMKDRRAADNPFAYLEPLNVRLDRRHDRRALTPDELRTLIATTETGPERFGMTGAAYSKHRREDTLPLRPALAEALKAHLAGKAPAAPAFSAPEDRRDFADLFKADREAAGIAYRDDAGRVADFHGFRHTFISNPPS